MSSAVYRSIISTAEKFVPNKLQPLWNHPAGMSTTPIYSLHWSFPFSPPRFFIWQYNLIYWRQQDFVFSGHVFFTLMTSLFSVDEWLSVVSLPTVSLGFEAGFAVSYPFQKFGRISGMSLLHFSTTVCVSDAQCFNFTLAVFEQFNQSIVPEAA